MPDKIFEIMGLMTELNPGKFALEDKVKNIKEFSKFDEQVEEKKEFFDINVSGSTVKEKSFFDLGAELAMNKHVEFCGSKEVATDKIYGFREIFKELHEKGGPSAVYPNFNYQMGLACREMGFIDESIEQLQIALSKGQNSFESASLLGFCYMDKGWWEEARQSFETALRVERAPAEKVLDIERALDVIRIEITREQEIHDPSNENSMEALDFNSESEEEPLSKPGLMAHEALSSLPSW
jgi:tetratricopeptide (TPR) repeat protein